MRSSAAAELAAALPEIPHDRDQRVLLNSVPWRTYGALRELLDSPGVRMTYLRGTLEIMSPSRAHEDFKKRIARMIELFALERDIALHGYGSTTFRREAGERGLEPDECYTLGSPMQEYPDIALEVIVTSGGINKLEVYRGLGVREVWMWMHDERRFRIWTLGMDAYAERERSELVQELDFPEIAELVQQVDQHAALREYRRRLQDGR